MRHVVDLAGKLQNIKVLAGGFCIQRAVYIGQNIIIRIHEMDVVAAGSFDTAVPGCAGILVLLPDQMHAGISFDVCLNDGYGIVRRAVIHQDQFKLTKGLLDNGLDETRKVLRSVIDRYDDGNKDAFILCQCEDSLLRRLSVAFRCIFVLQ